MLHQQIPHSADEKIVHRFVADAFRLDVTHVHEVVHGVNRTFRVTAGLDAQFFLRLYRENGRSTADIMAELDTLHAVRANGELDVSRPRCSRQGQYLLEISTTNGTRRKAVLFDRAKGREIAPTPEDMRKAGHALAELHQQRWLVDSAPSRVLASIDWIRHALSAISLHSTMSARLVGGIAQRCERIYDECTDQLARHWGFCHGDFRLANMRIQDRCITLFDFDDCGTGPQSFDLATLAWWLELGQAPDPAPLWSSFAEAYLDALPDRRLSQSTLAWLILCNEIRALQFLLSYCRLSHDLWAELFDRADQLSARALRRELRIYGGGSAYVSRI